jgi:hypothetical protein
LYSLGAWPTISFSSDNKHTHLQAPEKDTADVSTKRPADEGAASLNATEVLMLHTKLKIIQLVQEESFWVCLQHTDNTTHCKFQVERESGAGRIFLDVVETHRQLHTFQVERESQLLV